jgi:hypothetical protein
VTFPIRVPAFAEHPGIVSLPFCYNLYPLVQCDESGEVTATVDIS